MKNIGVVGKGFVGSAVAHGFSPAVGYNANVLVYDKDPLKSVDSLDDVVNKSDFIFVSVPTPSNKDGSISLDFLYACISEIEDAVKDNSPVVLVRSTVVPGTCEDIQSKFPKLEVIRSSIKKPYIYKNDTNIKAIVIDQEIADIKHSKLPIFKLTFSFDNRTFNEFKLFNVSLKLKKFI